ncbi:MAG TPA: ABC transporter permease [Polyangia bacterium]|nr:ABC transporter permease [Polyangia bacterium]
MRAPPRPLPGLAVWFARTFVGFVRRELAAMSGYRAAFLTRFAGFAVAVVSMVFFARFVGAAANPHMAAYGGNYLGFLAIGYLATELQTVGIQGLARRVRTSQIMGTLEAELATPAPAWMVLAAAPVYEFGTSALRSAVYLFGATLLVGLDLGRTNALTVIVAVPLVLAAFVGLGLFTAGSTMLVRRTNPVSIILGSLSLFVSGVMYPVSVLPSWLRVVGRALPLTHVLVVLRGAFLSGASPSAVGGSLAALAIFAAVLIPAGAATFAYALRRARIDGSLSHY